MRYNENFTFRQKCINLITNRQIGLHIFCKCNASNDFFTSTNIMDMELNTETHICGKYECGIHPFA